MKYVVIRLLAIFVVIGFCPVQAQSPAPVAGTDYVEISNGRPLDPADGMVVVEEYFNYICPACNAFEPHFAAWADKLPSDVKLVLIPAAFRPDFVPYARAYYAARNFNVAEEAHNAVYRAIHGARTLPAEGDAPDEARIAAFYADFGVDSDEFLKAMRSFDVDMKVRRGADHMRRIQVPGTPAIVVNGRYLVRGRNFADMLRITDYLIEKERGG